MGKLNAIVSSSRKYAALTPETEREKLVAYHDGNAEVLTEIVMPNVRGIIDLANGYVNMGVDVEDLFTAGYIAFVSNIDKYDINRNGNCRLFSVLRNYICNAMQDEIAKIGGGISVSRKIGKIPAVSLNVKTSKDDESGEIQDFIVDENDTHEKRIVGETAKYVLDVARKVLNEREFYVINHVIMQKEPMNAVAGEIGCTPTNVKNIVNKALEKIRVAVAELF